MMNKKIESLIDKYSITNGWAEVWRSWKDKMLLQKRDVKEEFLELPIPPRDKQLDTIIARDVIRDFLIWVEAHHGFCLSLHDTDKSIPKAGCLYPEHSQWHDTGKNKCMNCGRALSL